MGLGNSTTQTYLGVADGKIVRRFQEPTANSKQRTNKTGKIVHEEFYDYVEGLITSIVVKDTDWGKFWNVTLVDGNETYQLQFQYSGGNAQSFLKALPNVDLTKIVKLRPRVQIDGDKKRTSIMIIQNDQAIKWFWTKDNPGDLPPLRKVKIKGVEQWDDSDVMDYLENYVKSRQMPSAPPPVNAQEDEDMPF